MSDTPSTAKPPGRGAKVMKALILLAVSIKILTSMAPNHGPIFLIFSVLMVLGAIVFLLASIFS